MKPTTAVYAGQLSWRVTSDCVDARLTRLGGQLGPVVFKTKHGEIAPFALAPWAQEVPASRSPVLAALRGDFFCLPFGGNDTPWRGERHPGHGETANRRWTLRALTKTKDSTLLTAELKTRIRAGRVVKQLELRAGETNLYLKHTLHGLEGPMNFGHHAMLKFPEKPGSGRIALSPRSYAQVAPKQLEDPALGGYASLKIGARFRSLTRVPLATGGMTDLSRYPARSGFEDLVMLSSPPGETLAWTAVTFAEQRYVWFALKDQRVLASTVLWHSNGGRHYAPWNGRHRHVLGLEDVTSYFHYGLAESARPNPVSRRGIPTTLTLKAEQPLVVPYIMGVAAIPAGFDTVNHIAFGHGHIVLHAASGKKVRHAVDLDFLKTTP